VRRKREGRKGREERGSIGTGERRERE